MTGKKNLSDIFAGFVATQDGKAIPQEVRNSAKLLMLDAIGNAYAATTNSGSFNWRVANTGGAGRIESSALEGSSADLGDEFAAMIAAERDLLFRSCDVLEKVTGKQMYGIDVKLPNMLTAAVKACPVRGGKLKSFDAAKVESMPGVKKVVSIDGNAVVVVADTYWAARTALAALPVEWDVGKLGDVQQSDVVAMLKEGLTATEAYVGNKVGDAMAAIEGAAKKVTATYAFPWQNHAPMEPLNATALWTADKCEVWTGTQNGEAALAAASEAAELPIGKCEVYKLMLGDRKSVV